MKTRQRKREIVMKGLLSLAVVVALAGGASAGIIAQHDGPTEFDESWVNLTDNVTIGDEGTVEFEFNVTNLPSESSWANTGYLWSISDTGSGNPLYRIFLGTASPTNPTKMLKVFFGVPAGYAVNEEIPFGEGVGDLGTWHTLQLAWKDGEETLIILDGVEERRVTNAYALSDFSSDPGMHLMGAHRGHAGFYDGWMRNVKVHDVYIPEPSICVMLLAGALAVGLAWRRRQA